MRYYETLYIVHPDYEDERLEKIQQEVDQRIKRLGVNIINSYIWGKRKLAYPVEKQKYGTYMLLQYSADHLSLDSFNSWMELNESILAYMTVRLEEAPIPRDDEKSHVSSSHRDDIKERVNNQGETIT